MNVQGRSLAELHDIAGSPVTQCILSREFTNKYSVLAASESGAICMMRVRL